MPTLFPSPVSARYPLPAQESAADQPDTLRLCLLTLVLFLLLLVGRLTGAAAPAHTVGPQPAHPLLLRPHSSQFQARRPTSATQPPFAGAAALLTPILVAAN